MNTMGIYGKLPAYGDFLTRELDPAFVEVWDTWLQGFVSGGQEQLGENWLDTYLTSPIWRFAFSPGVVDEHVWAGIVLPSVDRVGRYFPISFIKKMSVSSCPTEVLSLGSQWFDALENIALQALEGEFSIDELIDDINSLPLELASDYIQQGPSSSAMGSVVRMDFEAQNAASTYPYVLDELLRQQHVSYSAWSTRGSNLVEPCSFFTKALPQISGIAAMLDGQWQESNWHEPYTLPLAEPAPAEINE